MITTNNDSVYPTADLLSSAGANITVLDIRADINSELNEKFNSKNIQIRFGAVPYNINGSSKIQSLDIADASHTPYKKTDTISCDQILMSGGWSPVVHLLSQRGVRPIWNAENLCFLPNGTNENITIIGSSRGIWNKEDCVQSGIAGALEAMNRLGLTTTNYFFPKVGGWKNPIKPLYEVKYNKSHSKSFVDYQHDVKADDVRLAHREGFISVEHLKRYTTLGLSLIHI